MSTYSTATARDWNRSFTHIEHRAAPGRLAERVWCTKFQSLLLNIYFRLKRVPVLAPTYSLPLRSQYLFRWHRTYPIGDAPLRCQDAPPYRRGTASFRYRNRAEISALTVNGSLIRYGFRAGARAIRYSVPQCCLRLHGGIAVFGVYRSVLFCGI